MASTTAANCETAIKLARQGFHVFPCYAGGEKAKSPRGLFRWRDVSTTNVQTILAWGRKWPDAAFAIDLAKSGHIVIDADRHGAHDGVEAFGALMAEHGFDPDSCPLVATPNEGNHHFFRQPEGRQYGNTTGALPPGVDVRGHGGYVIAPGTVMTDGRVYELHGDLVMAPVLPAWLEAIITARRGGAPALPRPVPAQRLSSGGLDEIAELLDYVDPDSIYNEWIEVLMAVHNATNGSSAGLDLADAWSARGSKYKGRREIELKWRSFKVGGGIGLPTLADYARRYGADLSEISIRHNRPQGYDPIEAAEAARRIIEGKDGVILDAETGEVVEPPLKPPVQIEAIYPPGLVGAIAQWIVATARRPQPELAIAAALGIVGTAAGRQFAGPTKSGTHLYILGLAPTASGKDHPMQMISRVMTAANLGLHVGPSEFISMPAVVNFIARKPLSVCAMDEFGSFMARINSKRASGFEGAISKVLRQMWSSSFAPYVTPEWAQKEMIVVHSPSITIYGTSTPEQFYRAMEGASIEDGTLNRFLLVNGRDSVAEVEPEWDAAKVPADIIRDIQLIYYRSGQMLAAARNDPHTDPAAHGVVRHLTWCPDGAQECYKAFSAHIHALMAATPDHAALWGRTAEMALRIATIVAIGRLEGDDSVRLADLEFGIAMATRSAEMMIAGAMEYMAENQNQADAQKILRIIRARGGMMKYRDLVQSLKNSIKPRDLRDILAFMAEAGTIERRPGGNDRGPEATVYRLIV